MKYTSLRILDSFGNIFCNIKDIQKDVFVNFHSNLKHSNIIDKDYEDYLKDWNVKEFKTRLDCLQYYNIKDAKIMISQIYFFDIYIYIYIYIYIFFMDIFSNILLAGVDFCIKFNNLHKQFKLSHQINPNNQLISLPYNKLKPVMKINDNEINDDDEINEISKIVCSTFSEHFKENDLKKKKSLIIFKFFS
jgi:hypothetical protein